MFRKNTLENVTEKAIERVDENEWTCLLRFLAQFFPITAGLMSLLDSKANKIFQKKVSVFFEDFEERISKLEINQDNLPDEFLYLFTLTVEKVIKSRTDEKVRRFAAILGNYFKDNMESSEDTFSAIQLCEELEDIHIEILKIALAGHIPEHFPSPIIILNEELNSFGETIFNHLHHHDKVNLLIACQKLLALGILYDESSGRARGGPMQILSPTDIATWFVNKITQY